MPLQPVDVVVAKARVRGHPEIEVMTPPEIRVRPNQPVRVKYLYSLNENSRAKEEWGFQLDSQLGPQARAPVSSITKDRFALHDEVWGVLVQEFSLDCPGSYAGTFRVGASYAKSRWRRAPQREETRRDAHGIFRVHVEEHHEKEPRIKSPSL